jgi:error-prone DNA polymerase
VTFPWAKACSRSCGSLQERGYVPCAALRTERDGRRIAIAGLVLVRQMPGSAKGVMFITLEDENANANLIIWPSVFEGSRRAILGATLMGCRGKLQKANGVIHLIVEDVADLSAEVKRVSGLDAPFTLARGAATKQRLAEAAGTAGSPKRRSTGRATCTSLTFTSIR